jgi:hypothetical protein
VATIALPMKKALVRPGAGYFSTYQWTEDQRGAPRTGHPRELLPDSLKDEPSGGGFLCFLFLVLDAA